MGVTTKTQNRKVEPTHYKPTDRRRLFMPKAQAVAENLRYKEKIRQIEALKKSIVQEETVDMAPKEVVKEQVQVTEEVAVTAPVEHKDVHAANPMVRRGRPKRKVQA